MAVRLVSPSSVFILLLAAVACRDNARDSSGASGKSLPPVFSLGPASNTNWDVNAGPVMLVSLEGGADSASIVLPEVTDTTIADVQGIAPPVSGLVFELFGRGSNIDSSAVSSPAPPSANTPPRECNAWPVVKVKPGHPGWRVGLVRGNARVIPLDSIESLSSRDSAALAASLAQSAATLPVSADPVFRRLPFRVRSAYTFDLDSTEVVVADVVRTLNEEANPRIEDLLLIGERHKGAGGSYSVGYFSRIAGPEETMQATEILAALAIGSSKRPALIVSTESEEGTRLGFIERVQTGQWRPTWKSAYTDC